MFVIVLVVGLLMKASAWLVLLLPVMTDEYELDGDPLEELEWLLVTEEMLPLRLLPKLLLKLL